jgi:hypothetical protein
VNDKETSRNSNVIWYLDVDFTQAYYPGDGCCIQWNVDGTCCVDIYQQCCGAAEYVNNYYTDNN